MYMKTRTNFRFSDRAMADLAVLLSAWGLDRTAVVERALSEAAERHRPHSAKASAEQREAARNARHAAKSVHIHEERQCVPTQLESDAEALIAAARGGIARAPQQRWVNRPDPDKIAAAQRLHGMAGGKKHG